MGQEFPGVFAAQKKDGTVYYRASLTHQKNISVWAVIPRLLLPTAPIWRAARSLRIPPLPSAPIPAGRSCLLVSGYVLSISGITIFIFPRLFMCGKNISSIILRQRISLNLTLMTCFIILPTKSCAGEGIFLLRIMGCKLI